MTGVNPTGSAHRPLLDRFRSVREMKKVNLHRRKGNDWLGGRTLTCSPWVTFILFVQWAATLACIEGVPVIDSVTPAYGSLAGGTFITIRGSNLASAGQEPFKHGVKVLLGGPLGALLPMQTKRGLV